MVDGKHAQNVTKTFTQEEITEIKKVFAMVDKDGSGSIDSSELGKLIKDLTQETPSKESISSFIKKVDKDNDGKIDIGEFLKALEEWIQTGYGSVEEDHAPPLNRKRKAVASPKTARAKLHKKIAAFFVCFKQSDDFTAVRSRYAELERNSTTQRSSIRDDSNMIIVTTSTEDKKKSLERAKKGIKNMSANIRDLTTPEKCAAAWKFISENILSAVECFATAEERFQYSDDVIRIYERVREMSIISQVCRHVKEIRYPELQRWALRLLTLYAPGPRIAHTPKDSAIHPDNMMHKKDIARQPEVLERSVILITHPRTRPKVRAQLLQFLGAFASNDHDARVKLIQIGIVPALLKCIQRVPIDVLRSVAWTLSIICGHTHDRKKAVPLEVRKKHMYVGKCLAGQYFMLNNREDEDVLVHAACGIRYLLPGRKYPASVIKRLIHLLQFPSGRLAKILLGCFTDLIKIRDSVAKCLVEFGLLKQIQWLLKRYTDTSEYDIRLQCCELLAALTGELGCVAEVIDHDIIPLMVSLIFNDDIVRNKAMEVIKLSTQAGPKQLKHLVIELNLVKTLSNCFPLLKSYDSVLREIYNYYGPSYNFAFLEDVVDSLVKLSSLTGPEVEYVNQFEFELLDKMKGVMRQLVTDLNEQAFSWKEQRKGPGIEVEMKTLMMTIQEMHTKAKTPAMNHIQRIVGEFLREFDSLYKKADAKRKRMKVQQLKKQSSTDSLWESEGKDIGGPTIRVKCFFKGRNKAIKLPAGVKLERLRTKIRVEYGIANVKLQYKDSDGDPIDLESDSDLRSAIEQAKANYEPLRIEIQSASKFGGAGDDFKDHHSKNEYINYLFETTEFSKKELHTIYSGFEKQTNNMKLEKEAFSRGMKHVIKNSKIDLSEKLIGAIFSALDRGEDGTVDFEEYVRGMNVFRSDPYSDEVPAAEITRSSPSSFMFATASSCPFQHHSPYRSACMRVPVCQ